MANFSRDPATVLDENREKGYVGVHIEQGVPVLDRDMNLMHDLLWSMVRSLFTKFIGNGVADDSNAFQIVGENLENDFVINGPGTILVNGWEVGIGDPVRYSSQENVPPLTPSEGGQREDSVYLDVWTNEVSGVDDPDLLNDADVGMQTSVRVQLLWRVGVAEGADPPDPQLDHAHFLLGEIRRPAGTAAITTEMITDKRQTRLNLAEMEQRLRELETVAAPVFAEPGQQFEPIRQSSGEPITLFGSNFDVGGEPTVLFGAIRAEVRSYVANQIVTIVPEGLDPENPVQLTVRTRGGEVTSDDMFDVR